MRPDHRPRDSPAGAGASTEARLPAGSVVDLGQVTDDQQMCGWHGTDRFVRPENDLSPGRFEVEAGIGTSSCFGPVRSAGALDHPIVFDEEEDRAGQDGNSGI